MADVVLQGVSQNSPPGVYVQLNFAQGAASAPVEVYSAIILANPVAGTPAASTAAGTVYGPTTVVSMQTQADINSLAGNGSPAALMVAAFLAQNKSSPLFYAPVQQASGTSGSLAITVSVSAGQSVGVVRFRVDGKPPVDTVFAATDSAST